MNRFLRAWAPLAAWLVVIAVNSTYLASVESVEEVTRRIAQVLGLEPGTPQASTTLRRVLFALRKPAHILQYGVLALLAFRALTSYRPQRPRLAAAVAMLLAFAVAVADELHQHTVTARTGSGRDVAIDTAGAGLGLLVLVGWRRWRGRR